MLHRMATLTGRTGQLSRARVLEMCEQHLLANERSDESLLSLLGFIEGLGFTELAKELADRHIPADTSSAGLLLLRASLALGTGAGESAETLLERGAMAAPDIKDFLDAATGLLERYDRPGDAIRLLESALQVRPDLPAIAMDLAWRLSISTSPDWEKIAGLIDGVAARVPAQLEKGVRILQGGSRYDLARPILVKARASADEGAAWTATRLMLQSAAENGAHAEVLEIVESYTARKLPGFRLQSLSDLLFEYGFLPEGLALLEENEGKDPNQAAGVLRALKLIQTGRIDEGSKLIDVFFEELVLGHRKLTRSDRMTAELHKLFDSVNDFLWDMDLGAQAGLQLDRAIETYPDDPFLLIRRCRSLLSAPEAKPEDALALFDRLLSIDTEPASLQTRSLVHHLAARGLDVQATNLMLDAFDPAAPRWWAPMLLELLVVQENHAMLRRAVEQLATRPAGSPELLATSGATLLARGEVELAEVLLRQALVRTRQHEATRTAGPKAGIFSQVEDPTGPAPDAQLTSRIMVFLIRAMAAGGAPADAIQAAARGALRLQADAKGGISPEARLLLASALEEVEVWDAALAEWGLQQALGEGGATPYLREFRIHLIRGDEVAARETLWRCVATTPGTLGLLTRFAEQARRILALDLSVELYSMARSLDGANLALAFAASEPLLLLGRTDDAGKLLELYAGDGGPDSIRNQRLEAAALAYRYNQFALADSLMEGVDSAPSWMERARSHLRAGDVDLGWRQFEEAVRRAPSAALAARALLVTLLEGPAPAPRLIENLLASAQTATENPSVNRFWEGVLLLQRSRWDAAVRSFEAGLRGTRARFGLGITMFKQLLINGRVQEAEAFARSAFAGFKATAVHTEMAKAIAETLHGGLVPQEHIPAVVGLGVRVARAALSSDPADTWILTQLAEVQFAGGRVDDAVKTYDKAIADLPGDSGMENNQAYLLALTGRETERGLALVQAAIRREPSHNIFYLDTLGWLQYGQGRLDEAERSIRAALVRADFSTPGGLAEALYHLGIVQRDLGRLDDAKATLHRASVNDPFGVYGGRARKELEMLGVDPYHR
ncbi:MAG: tetratricopeptide repeat protein [Pseudomonadota bacterium]